MFRALQTVLLALLQTTARETQEEEPVRLEALFAGFWKDYPSLKPNSSAGLALGTDAGFPLGLQLCSGEVTSFFSPATGSSGRQAMLIGIK